MKTLLLAEACNPEWTSVPLVGFNMVRALARANPAHVTLVTHVRNRDALNRHDISSDLEIIYVDNEWLAGPLYRLGRLLRGGQSLGWTTNMAVNWPAYIAFEKSVAQQLKPRLNAGEFSLIHRVTPVSPTLPSLLAETTDVPMLIGPINGGLPWPQEFPDLRGSEREWLTRFRAVYQYLPYYRRCYRNLAGVICGSRHTLSELPSFFRGKSFYLPENGIDPDCFELASDWTPPTGRYEFVTVGRLVPYKGFHLLLDAIASAPILRTCRLTIIGDGPERVSLMDRASALGIADLVEFTGWLPQAEVSQRLRSSQAFVFPSLREFGGGVVLEAMASGLPSIVMNYGGPGELINDTCGLLLPMQPRESLVPALADAMVALATNDNYSRQLGRAAIQIVQDRFTWDRKAAAIEQIYDSLLGQTAAVRSPWTAHSAINPQRQRSSSLS